MATHVIVGSGAVGTATARLLADAGEQVVVITRRGGGPRHDAVRLIAADATDTDRLSALANGAVALYNCANPRYHRWLTDWPPLAASLLTAAERTGAVLVTTGNLYGYGPTDAVITENTPLAATNPKLRIRADLWRQALDAHRAGRVRVTEARGSDYFGPHSMSLLSMFVLPAVRKGRIAWIPADLDAPHSFTYTGDVARTLVALAGDQRAWGRAWHVPTHPATTIRQFVARASQVGGLPAPRLRSVPSSVLWMAGLFSADARELRHTEYQWRRPFVMDSATSEAELGLKPTDLDDALRASVAPEPR